jgi:adenylate kinase
MRMLLLGAPGSGKGTQAIKLADKYKAVHLSTGDILREAVQSETEIGMVAKSFMESGELVPDEIIDNIMEVRVAEPDCQVGYILDGYPRTISQAKYFDNVLDKLRQEFTGIVYFNVAKEELVERLSGRLYCSECKAGFHLTFQPPKDEGICDECGGDLVQRKDDTKETIVQRLEVYNRETEPLLEFYQAKDQLHEIDAVGDINDVFKRVCSLIDN